MCTQCRMQVAVSYDVAVCEKEGYAGDDLSRDQIGRCAARDALRRAKND